MAEPDSAALAGLDRVEHVAQLVSFGEVAQFRSQILLQRLVALLGLSLKGSVDVVGEIANEHVRHACTVDAWSSQPTYRGERTPWTPDSPGQTPLWHLSPQLVATLAEPFQRGAERVRTRHGGVGLGLAIVDSITRGHDGTLTLTLTPRPTGGLRVTVHQPAQPSHTTG